MTEAATGGALVFLKISQINWKTLVPGSLLFRSEANNFTEKETLAHVFSSEFCVIFKNTFNRTPLVAASEIA